MSESFSVNNKDFWLNIKYNKQNLKIFASFPMLIKKEANEFVIDVPVFNIFAYGHTIREVQDNTFAQLNDFLEMLTSNSKLQLFKWLNQLGWQYNSQDKRKDFFTFDYIEKIDKQAFDLRIANINYDFAINH